MADEDALSVAVVSARRDQRRWTETEEVYLVEQANELQVNCPPGKEKMGVLFEKLRATLNGHHLFKGDPLTINQV